MTLAVRPIGSKRVGKIVVPIDGERQRIRHHPTMPIDTHLRSRALRALIRYTIMYRKTLTDLNSRRGAPELGGARNQSASQHNFNSR